MPDADNVKSGEDDRSLLDAEVSEPVILQEPDRVSDAPASPVSAPQTALPKQERSNSGLLGFVLGGAVLAGGGFAAAKYVFPDTRAGDAIASLQAQLDASAVAEATFRDDIAALTARPVSDATLAERLSALEPALTDLSAVQARLTTLEQRLTAIETVSVSGEGAPAAGLAVMSREIADLKAALQAQQGAGTALTADVKAASDAAQSRLDAAELAAETAAKQASLSHIRAAFDSGAPLGPAFEGMKAMGVEIPPALASAAGAVPTLMALQDGFAEPARAALDASIRADMGEGWASRLMSFLRTQSGARSLTPKDGPDPDAVLSRAEAAVRGGNLAVALAELTGLPPAGAEAMAGWVADATQRINTEKAISDLSSTLSGQ